MADSCYFESVGVPCAALVSTGFKGQAVFQAQQLGMSKAVRLFVPHPISDCTKAQLEAKADAIVRPFRCSHRRSLDSFTRLNSTQINSTQLNSTQVNSTQLNSTQVNSTRLNSPTISIFALFLLHDSSTRLSWLSRVMILAQCRKPKTRGCQRRPPPPPPRRTERRRRSVPRETNKRKHRTQALA